MRFKKTIMIVSVIFLIAIGIFITDTLNSAGVFRKIEPHFSGSCTRVEGVVGAEDITIHPVTGIAYISAMDRRTLSANGAYHGGIYSYAPGSFERPEKLVLDDTAFFHPHGIDLWVDNSGNTRLFAITHPPAVPTANENFRSTSQIEIFNIIGNQLTRVKVLAPKDPISLNDVAAAGPNSFYASIDQGSTTPLGRTVEQYGRLARAGVLYGNGAETRKVLGNLVYANGVQVSNDGNTLYVAETTGKRLSSYSINEETGALTLTTEQEFNSALDNIEIDAAGNLWIAGHPKTFDFLAHAGDKNKYSPSQVFKINESTDGFNTEEIYLNDGTPISGSSVAAPTDNGFLIGSVFEPFILDCRIE